MMSPGQMPDFLEAGVCDVPYYKVPRGGQTCWRLGLADVRHKTCLWGLKLKGCAGDTFKPQPPASLASEALGIVVTSENHSELENPRPASIIEETII